MIFGTKVSLQLMENEKGSMRDMCQLNRRVKQRIKIITISHGKQSGKKPTNVITSRLHNKF